MNKSVHDESEAYHTKLKGKGCETLGIGPIVSTYCHITDILKQQEKTHPISYDINKGIYNGVDNNSQMSTVMQP